MKCVQDHKHFKGCVVDCIGCEQEFILTRSTQKRCKKGCKSKRLLGTNLSRDEERARLRAELPTFIGVDGEGFGRLRDRFTPYSDMTEEELDECNELIEAGDLETEYEEDEETGAMIPGIYESVDYHAYELFGIGDQWIGKAGVELTHHEVFEFLYSHYESCDDPKRAYVGFFLGYDFIMWVRHLYEKTAWKLVTPAGKESRTRRTFNDDGTIKSQITFPVTAWDYDYGVQDWDIEMLGHKRFSLRRHIPFEERVLKRTYIDEEGEERKEYEPHPHKWMHICDAGSFFQTSLLNAIDPTKAVEPIVTAEEFALLKRGKDRRSDAEFDSETVEYNMMENEVLSRLMKQLAGSFADIGIQLRTNQWYGPGAAAQATLNMWQVPEGKEIREHLSKEFDTVARYSYYGGWFETMIIGPYPEKVYEYDINSAYPAIIESLPCLLHAREDSGTGNPPDYEKDSDIIFVDAETQTFPLSIGYLPAFGGLSHRILDGSISRPLETRGWHSLREVQAAGRAYCHKDVIYYSWRRIRVGCDCPSPFAKIKEMYQERLTVGKNSPRGIAMKLVYNSIYGKLAQSIGVPKYAMSVYATLITSGCRTMILDAVSKLPGKSHDVLMIATDGLYTTAPAEGLHIDGETLGAWEAKELNGFTAVMPGVHWTDKTLTDVMKAREEAGLGKPDFSSIKLKSRGVSARDIGGSIFEFKRQFEEMVNLPVGTLIEDFPEVEVNIEFSIVSAKLSLARNKWETCGTVEPTTRVISTKPFSKRTAAHVVLSPSRRPYVRTFPYLQSLQLRTRYYGSLFGTDLANTIFEEDFDSLVTERGELGGHIMRTLGRSL